MPNPFVVKTLKLISGERLPILIDIRVGAPLFSPTVYSLTQLRGRNLAANTIKHGLRHIMVLLLFLEQNVIDIEARFRTGRMLELGEIEALANICSKRVEDIVQEGFGSASLGRKRVASLGAQRARRTASRAIAPLSVANRIRDIASYLDWCSKAHLLKVPANSADFHALHAISRIVIETLLARAPDDQGRTVLGSREGLPEEAAARLLAVTARNSPENPWQGEFTRSRNEVIFRWLHSFGLRRGELLNVKISDIDFRKETVTIVRRADAAEDPRGEQPTVKTRDRVIPIPHDLCRITYDYVIQARRHLVGARMHEYLFVADKSGAPMSLSALNKCFAFLRTRVSDLPGDLSPHVLRHTWNDNFSAAMDRKHTPGPDEEKMRSFLMGWSETAGTAATYTKRHVRKKASEASLMLQSGLLKGNEI